MTIRGVEPSINALIARLESELAAAIDTVNAEAADDITVPAPAQILPYVPPPSMLTAFPTVGVGHGPDRFEDDNGWAATGVYDIHLVAFLQHSDQRALTIQVRRMKLALMRVALEDRNLGAGAGIAWGITYIGGDYGPSLGKTVSGDGPPSAYMTWCAIGLRCKSEEQ